MDLAVAVFIGAAFTAIVTPLTFRIINPLLRVVIGKPNFDYLTSVIYFDLVSAHRSSHVLLPRTASAEPDEDPKPSKLQ